MTGTVLMLVRHGATRANICRPHILQGLRPDPDLIAQGQEQARSAARALQAYPVARLYSSPLRRAVQTAAEIAEAIQVPVRVEPALVEADVGQWADRTWPEIERHWPAECRAFHEDPERHGYVGGENLAQVRDRVLPAVEDLVGRHEGETVVVVGHGVVNRVLLAHWLGMPLRYARQVPQDNAGISSVEFHGGAARVRTVNAAAHLTGLLPGAA